MMRVTAIAIGAVVLAGSAAAQLGPVSQPPEAGRTAEPKGGADEGLAAPGAGWSRVYDANGHMREADYRAALAGELAAAEAMLGKPLTDGDRKKIRSALQGDLIAWRKQYDPRRADYRAIRAQYLVDESSLSADGWAKQRVAWLRAQQQWILANAGEIQAEAVRSR
jgi:hypothetical protein